MLGWRLSGTCGSHDGRSRLESFTWHHVTWPAEGGARRDVPGPRRRGAGARPRLRHLLLPDARRSPRSCSGSYTGVRQCSTAVSPPSPPRLPPARPIALGQRVAVGPRPRPRARGYRGAVRLPVRALPRSAATRPDGAWPAASSLRRRCLVQLGACPERPSSRLGAREAPPRRVLSRAHSACCPRRSLRPCIASVSRAGQVEAARADRPSGQPRRFDESSGFSPPLDSPPPVRNGCAQIGDMAFDSREGGCASRQSHSAVDRRRRATRGRRQQDPDIFMAEYRHSAAGPPR